MLIDGKTIAADIYTELSQEIKNFKDKPRLTVLTCAPNFETQKYLNLKKRRAEDLGISVNVVELPNDVTTDEVLISLECAARITDGVIVQLPFPEQVNIDKVLEAVPMPKDVDVVHYNGEYTEVLPPVVGAVAEIAKRHAVDFQNKKVVVIGEGRLVGRPAVLWLTNQGAKVDVINKSTINPEQFLQEADVIISGAGVSGLIIPDKIKEGVILFDAGTSEESGMLRGDADPACAPKCSIFTPVPGGIGPVTVAILLRNLVLLLKDKK